MPAPLLISSTEPPAIRALGHCSQTPEQFGVDVMWLTNEGRACGVQRKEIKDLVASMEDGRLAMESKQMSALSTAFLVIEGRLNWSTEGELLNVSSWTKLKRPRYRSLLRSIQAEGIIVGHTDSTQDTVAEIVAIRDWSEGEHTSLSVRPKPKGTWGVATDRDYAIHLLQSVQGIGAKTAGLIFDHFEGRIPIAPTITPEELLTVPGVGKDTVKKFWRAFTGEDPSWTPKRTARKTKKDD